MENQHRKITGYRELSQAEIDLMNKIKKKGEELGELIEDMRKQYAEENILLDKSEYNDITSEAYDSLFEATRWMYIGKDHIQQGLMALTRSVARPNSF